MKRRGEEKRMEKVLQKVSERIAETIILHKSSHVWLVSQWAVAMCAHEYYPVH